MKASEARRLSDNANHANLSSLLQKIEAAARKGETSIRESLGDATTEYIKSAKEQLKALGYTVSHESGYDQRDQQSWNYFIITW